ncbi:hypothetical protein AB4Y45_32260 [Paraburkholderia sp. EG287A]|uniref:hypothetical protein n=1 Tax=Paraburkholderia sp. EG287A TaxID=3237012 RepID=UPI0034D367AA
MTQLTEADVKKLIQQGYCRTSNKHGHVSRIDCADWAKRLTKERSPSRVYEAVRGMGGLARAEDQYRRVYSRDTLDVGRTVSQFPSSIGTVTGYRPKEAV